MYMFVQVNVYIDDKFVPYITTTKYRQGYCQIITTLELKIYNYCMFYKVGEVYFVD